MRIFGNEEGSIAPLGIGLVIITAGLALTIICGASLFIFQKRLTNLAESAALFAGSHIQSVGSSAETFLSEVGTLNFENLSIRNDLLPDNKTVEAHACATWRPPIAAVDKISSLEVCSHAAVRSGF